MTRASCGWAFGALATAVLACPAAPLGPPVDGSAAATCNTGGYDLPEGMVYAGWALADPATGARCRELERGAREASRGLWSGAFEAPWDWRVRRGTAAAGE